MADFEEAIEQAVTEAKQAAEETDRGDPGTMVSATVDGRCGFAKKMHSLGGEVNDVKVTDDNGLVLPLPSGQAVQLHSKRIAALRAFAETMEEHGWNVGLDVSTYSY